MSSDAFLEEIGYLMNKYFWEHEIFNVGIGYSPLEVEKLLLPHFNVPNITLTNRATIRFSDEETEYTIKTNYSFSDSEKSADKPKKVRYVYNIENYYSTKELGVAS